MYERTSNSGHTVEWNPDDEQAAAEAIVECPHTECEDHEDAVAGEAEQVDRETARDIRERYTEKITAPDETK